MRRVLVAAALSCALALVLVGIAIADGTPLAGSVGPGFSITLKDRLGATVTHLDKGAYTLSITDQSAEHNFHLQGPGTDVATTVDGTGTNAFAVNLVDGTYQFFCDAHPAQMKGSFTVGSVTTPPPSTPPPTTPPPTTPPPSTPPPATTPPKLTLTVTAKTVTLKRAGGSAVRRLAPGVYSVKAVDRSAKQNAHLLGAGVNRKTGIAFTGTVTWKLKLKAGTLTYRSDAAKPKLRAGKIVVSASATS